MECGDVRVVPRQSETCHVHRDSAGRSGWPPSGYARHLVERFGLATVPLRCTSVERRALPSFIKLAMCPRSPPSRRGRSDEAPPRRRLGPGRSRTLFGHPLGHPPSRTATASCPSHRRSTQPAREHPRVLIVGNDLTPGAIPQPPNVRIRVSGAGSGGVHCARLVPERSRSRSAWTAQGYAGVGIRARPLRIVQLEPAVGDDQLGVCGERRVHPCDEGAECWRYVNT